MTDLALLQNVLCNEIMRSVPHLNAQAKMFGSELAILMCVGFLQWLGPFWPTKQPSIVLNCYSVTLCTMLVYLPFCKPQETCTTWVTAVGVSVCLSFSPSVCQLPRFLLPRATSQQKAIQPTVKCLHYLDFKFTIFAKSYVLKLWRDIKQDVQHWLLLFPFNS